MCLGVILDLGPRSIEIQEMVKIRDDLSPILILILGVSVGVIWLWLAAAAARMGVEQQSTGDGERVVSAESKSIQPERWVEGRER